MKQTKMSRFLVLLFGIFLFSCCAASFDTGDQLSWIDKKEVSASRERVRRMVSFLTAAHIAGDRVAKQILKGATRMPEKTKYRNEYVKEGGFQRAVKDFERANPHNIHYLQEADTALVQVGTVGDRTIILKGPVPGEATRPTVTIVKSDHVNDPGAVFDVITYFW